MARVVMVVALIWGPRKIADFVGWSSGVLAKSQILWGGHPGSSQNRRFCGVVIRGPRKIADFVGWSSLRLHDVQQCAHDGLTRVRNLEAVAGQRPGGGELSPGGVAEAPLGRGR